MRYKIIWPAGWRGERRVRVVRKRGSRAEYLKHKEVARLLTENRISHYNKLYNFKINRIAIKNTKSRWGSCSKKGNLNFNYKIALLPIELADYVIVHELCHLGELNHSSRFWKLIEMVLPNYKELRKRFQKDILL